MKTKRIKKKTQKSQKSQKKSNIQYNPSIDFFQTNARLNSTQRKYCHCLMTLRKNKKVTSPYPICTSFLKKKKLLDYNLKSNKYNYKKSKKRAPQMNPKITHCLMNYDLYKYDLDQIQSLALEKKIPIYYYKSSNKNRTKQFLTKNTLISKIKSKYLIKTKKLKKNQNVKSK